MRDISSHATPPGAPGGQHRPTSATFRRALISHPDEMAQTIVELHCIIRNEHDLLRLLHRTAQVAVRCIPGAHWVSVTAQLDGAPFTVAHTDERALGFDEDQYALDDGPGLRAMRTYELTSISYADVVRQWPTLARTAAEIGSIIVAPLSGMPSPVGSVNIYSATDFSLDTQTRDFLAVLEEYVNRGMADYAALHSADMLAANLREAIRSRAPIEQAKGILMAVHQIGEEEAFRMLLGEDDPLATQDEVSIQAFEGRPFLITERPMAETVHDRTIAFFAAHGVAPSWRHHRLMGYEQIGPFIAASYAATLIHSHLGEVELPGVRVLPLVETAPRYDIAVAWRRDDRSPLAATLGRWAPQDHPQRTAATRGARPRPALTASKTQPRGA